MATTTPYIPPRKFPPVIENRYRINYWSTCNHYWQFSSDQRIADLGSRDTFLRAQVNRRRDYFSGPCGDSATSTATSPPDPTCCVGCRDEDLLVNVPGYIAAASNVTNALNGVLSDTVALDSGLDSEDSKAVRLVGAPSTCVLLGRLADDAPYGRLCLRRPEMCDYGMSASVWVNFTEENYVKTVLLATSSYNSQGFQFYTEGGQLSLVVIGARGRWQASVNGFDPKVGRWRLLGFTWERSTGIVRIYIDGWVTTFYFASTYSEPNAQGFPANEIRLGCEILAGGESASHLKATVVHPALWLWPIAEENLMLLTGSLVYKLIKYQLTPATPVPTTAPKPEFAYSTILRELGSPTSASNPFYELADFYLSAGVSLGDLSGAPASTNVTVTNWLRGGQTGANFYIRSSPAQVDIAGLGATCAALQSLCPDGISLSLWLLPTQPLPAAGDLEFLRFNIFSLSLRNASSNVQLQVRAGARFAACQVPLQQWSNLGLVYDLRGPVPTLGLYINGLACASSSSDSPGTLGNYNGNVTLGSSSGAATPAGLVLNHLAVWYRSLEAHEVHRFLGYTLDQMRYIREASLYWTTDPVVNSDSLLLKDTPSYNLKSIYRIDLPSVLDSAITFETDRYNKSPVASLNPNWLAQFFLGKDIQRRPTEDSIAWAGACITDPFQRRCQISGLTMHMWIKIKSVDPNRRQFFFSSGDFADARSSLLDSRGISMFTTGALLGASVSTDRSDWAIVIDGNRFGLNEWFNFGFTWRQQEGMRLFLNGTDYGISNLHPDISYKAYDKHTRAVVGRFDDDQNATWKGNSDWTMGNFSLGDVVFYERWMSPAEFARAVGSVNNRFYRSCDLLVSGQDIIDTRFLLLKQAKLLAVPIGPKGNVSQYDTDSAMIAMNGQVGVKAFRFDECPRSLGVCANQIILTLWMKLQRKDSGTPLTVLSLGDEADLREGFGLNISSDCSLVAWTKRAGSTVKIVTKSSVKVRYGRWINLALHLAKITQYPTIFLNGTNVSVSLEFRSETPGGVPYAASNSAATLTVGRAAPVPNPSTADSFLLHLVAGWYVTPLANSQMYSILGVQSSQYNLMRTADDYWTVAGLWSRLQPYPLLGINANLGRDRYDTENGAQCTSGTGGSYISLGDLQGSCLVNTSPCKAYILTLNVKPAASTASGRAYLLSTGGQAPGNLGAAISISSDGFLVATVRSPNRTCETTVPFNTTDWVQLQVRWYTDSFVTVKINEENILPSNATCWQESNSNLTYTVGQLGKVNSDASNASAACFSDVMFKYQLLGSSDSLATDVGPATCYEQQIAQLPMHTVGNSNHDNKANRSRRFSNAESASLSADVCLFAGTGCPRGLAASVWLRVESLGTDDYVDVLNMGYPTSQGLRIRIKKVVSGDAPVSYMIVADGNVAGSTRQIEIGATSSQRTLVGTWVNVGVSFTAASLELYINGVQVNASTRMANQSLPLAASATAVLGSSSTVMLMSDLVLWNEPPLNCLDPNRNRKILTGDCGAATQSLQTTCLPDGATSCQSSIQNGLCLDELVENIVAIDKSGRLFSGQAEADTACRVVAGTAARSGAVTLEFVQSTLTILSRVAANLAPAGGITNVTLSDTVGAFSRAFSAAMSPSYADRIRPMVDSGQVNPAGIFASVETLALRLSTQLASACSPVTSTEGRLHWSTLIVGPACADSPVEALQYTERTRALWSRAWDTVQLPSSLFSGRSSDVKVACVVYDSTDDLLASDATNATVASSLVNGTISLKVNSRVASILTSLPSSVTQRLADPLNITLQLTRPNVRSKKDPRNLQLETRCVFWDPSKAGVSSLGRGMWSTEGCIKLWEDELSVSCSCYHTTSFAILMQPVPASNDNVHTKILRFIAYVLTAMSLLCVLVFIVVVARGKQLHSEQYVLHLNMAAALLVAQLTAILASVAQDSADFCKAVAIVMHLFFAATMALLLAESVWLFHAVVKGVIRGRAKWLLPVAWLLPVGIVAAIAGFDSSVYGSQPFCWLSGVYVWTFLGPVLAFSGLALVGCLVVVCNLGEQAIKRKDIQAELSSQARHCALLAALLTLSWVFAVPLVLWYKVPIHYIFVIFNATQGFWLLLCLGLLNQDFMETLAICCGVKRSRRTDLSSSSVSVTGVQDISQSSSSLGSSATCGPPPNPNAPVYHTGKTDSREGSAHAERPRTALSSHTRQRDSQRALSPKSPGS